MGDNDTTGRRPKFVEGDIERASKARRHPRPASAPIVEQVIEDDVTPLPQEPPDISQMPGFETLPPAAQRAFLSMHNVQREHDVAFARLWDARHVGAELSAARGQLDQVARVLGALEHTPETLRQHAGLLNRMLTWAEERRKYDEKLDRTLEALDRRLDTIEGDFRDMKGAMASLGKDIAEGWRRRDAELEDFRSETEARFDKIDTDRKEEREKYEERIRSLEDSRLSLRAQAAAIALLVGALWALVTHFWK